MGEKINDPTVSLMEIGAARGYLLATIKEYHPHSNLIGVKPSPVMAKYAASLTHI